MKPLEWLLSLKKRGIHLGLERMQYLFSFVKPLDYRTIHVGGTNGKGSVCAYLGAILQDAGYNVGVYTSPHLEKLNERITVNGREISDEELEKHAEFFMKKKGSITFFECLTAIALSYFNHKVDFAVIEVGLGGRHDATNIISPTLTIITNVSKEHEVFLGQDIESIALEKAAIIKNVPVITAAKGKALKIIQEKAQNNNAPLVVIGKDVKWTHTSRNRFIIKANKCYEIHSPLYGMFQGENIAVAVGSAEVLGLSEKNIIRGIQKTKWYGRMEKIGQFLLDGAHNVTAINALKASLHECAYKNLYLIFGVMKDKDVKGMVDALPPSTHIFTTMVDDERAYPSKKLAEMIEDAIPTESVYEAIHKARENADDNDLICITGSLYVVGEARKIVQHLLHPTVSTGMRM
jgi:dihydrofolate synthase/folylpolyglutamate synthase